MTLTYENTSRMVATRSWNIHVNEVGPTDAETILLLHGSGPGATGWTNFSHNMPVLAERYRVIAADMPGWGDSDPVTWKDRDHPGAVLELLDALGIDRATLIGNSMGGGTTIRFGYEHPDRVNRLITMGASSGTSTIFGAGGLTEGIKIVQEGYRDPTFDTMRQVADVMTFDPRFATEDLVMERTRMVVSHPVHNRNFVEGIGKRPIVELDHTRVPSITAPTLLCHGRDDRVVHFEHSLKLVALIPDSRLVLLNRCGHWLQIEHAAEFNRLVMDFMTSTSPAST